MKAPHSICIYRNTAELPDNWDELAASTVFLTKSYLETTKKSAPNNMCCYFVGFFTDGILTGIAIAQYIDLYKLSSFGERDQCIKTAVRNFIFRKLAANVLILGNNMLTGENGWAFAKHTSSSYQQNCLALALVKLVDTLKSEGIAIHIQIAKDFYHTPSNLLSAAYFKSFYQFYIQPNMVFSLAEHWTSETDYTKDLQKKYRDQWKRARKKCAGVEKRTLDLELVAHYEAELFSLYNTVAKNAPFNTFFLAPHHFYNMKQQLAENFTIFGYFENNSLIGFCTLIQNGSVIDTYFLGYDEVLQKQKMLYLNMLYDMIDFTIIKKAKKMVLARTALEIKSSVGAKAIPMFGYIKHRNKLLNFFMKWIFNYLQPEIKWIERHPFI